MGSQIRVCNRPASRPDSWHAFYVEKLGLLVFFSFHFLGQGLLGIASCLHLANYTMSKMGYYMEVPSLMMSPILGGPDRDLERSHPRLAGQLWYGR